MSVALGLLVLSVVFLVVVIVSPRARKQVLITTTYISLTGWYYYRKWEKRSGTHEVKRKSRTASNKNNENESDVRFFESVDMVLQREEREERWSQPAVSESSYRLSETSSSGQSEEPSSKNGGGPKTHTGIFRKLRKSQREVQSDPPRLSDVSISSNMSTASRRTFSGRKKPATWGE